MDSWGVEWIVEESDDGGLRTWSSGISSLFDAAQDSFSLANTPSVPDASTPMYASESRWMRRTFWPWPVRSVGSGSTGGGRPGCVGRGTE